MEINPDTTETAKREFERHRAEVQRYIGQCSDIVQHAIIRHPSTFKWEEMVQSLPQPSDISESMQLECLKSLALGTCSAVRECWEESEGFHGEYLRWLEALYASSPLPQRLVWGADISFMGLGLPRRAVGFRFSDSERFLSELTRQRNDMVVSSEFPTLTLLRSGEWQIRSLVAATKATLGPFEGCSEAEVDEVCHKLWWHLIRGHAILSGALECLESEDDECILAGLGYLSGTAFGWQRFGWTAYSIRMFLKLLPSCGHFPKRKAMRVPTTESLSSAGRRFLCELAHLHGHVLTGDEGSTLSSLGELLKNAYTLASVERENRPKAS